MAFSGSPLTSITIPGGMDFTPAAMGQFGASFLDFYSEKGKRAGTYIFDISTWTFKENQT